MPTRARLPTPGPSFLREERIVVQPRGSQQPRTLTLGSFAPSATDDGWWLLLCWAADDAGIAEARDVAPADAPPAGSPLLVLGPMVSGELAGWVMEEGGRQALRVRLPPAEDESRPWERPLLLQVAIRWEPMRAATMTQQALARELVRAFGRALVRAGSAR